MADAIYSPSPGVSVRESPRHSVIVRVTHWVNTLSFFGLLVSGVAILLAHPRLYWGETGAVGGPSLIDLPLPFILADQTGWGRYLHFLSAWVVFFNGSVYALSSLITQHFRRDFPLYNSIQRLTYVLVVFGLFPLMFWTGLAMSPAITSVAPAIVSVFGGQQSARTIHFFTAGALFAFLFVHITMVCRAGFRVQMRAMLTGRES